MGIELLRKLCIRTQLSNIIHTPSLLVWLELSILIPIYGYTKGILNLRSRCWKRVRETLPLVSIWGTSVPPIGWAHQSHIQSLSMVLQHTVTTVSISHASIKLEGCKGSWRRESGMDFIPKHALRPWSWDDCDDHEL